jgi:hypothetical protein
MNSLTFDVEAAKQQLTQVFNDKIAAQGSVYMVQDLDLGGITFSDLEEKVKDQDQLITDMKGDLKQAQADGGTWFNDVQPILTAVPQAAINYATLWDTTTPLLVNQLNQPSPDRAQLQAFFGALRDSVDNQSQTLGGVIDALSNLRTRAFDDSTNFSTRHAPFKQLEEIDKENLEAARQAIAKLETEINKLNDEINSDIITANQDLTLASGAMKAGKQGGRGGKALGLIIGLFFIASASLALDQAMAAIHKRLDDAEKETEFQLELSSLNEQLICLQTASSALAAFVGQLDDLIKSVQQAKDCWGRERDRLTAVITDLQSDQPVDSILSEMDLRRAQGEWDDLRVFATNWQTMEVAASLHNELIIGGSDKAAAGSTAPR